MKLTVDFAPLAELARRMNASAVTWSPKAENLTAREELRERLRTTGIEINLPDVKRGPGGLLTYQGEQVFLYIKDTYKPLEILRDSPEKAVRYHVADCSTLEKMRAESRFERYVVTNKTSGEFACDWRDPDTRDRGTIDAKIKVCKNCLKLLKWRGYGDRGYVRDKIWKSFELSDFLLEYATFFHDLPSRKADETGLEDYTQDWSNISMRTRSERNCRCEICKVSAPERKDVLHVHHKNRIRNDNKPTNLQVLCALCHKDQPGHGHLNINTNVRATILRLRLEQSISMS